MRPTLKSKTVFFLTCFSLLLGSFAGKAQVADYYREMQRLSDSIDKHFYIPSINYYKETSVPEPGGKKVSYLWPLCAMFEAANETSRLTNDGKTFNNIFSVVKKYYNQKPPAPGFGSYAEAFGGGTRFYDDNQWIGITAMDAWATSKHEKWLKLGKHIFDFMMTGFDTVSGGGLYWEEGNMKTKNTCSNGPGIILALQLYKATHNQSYLDTALLLYNWVNENLRTADGLYYDNVILKNNEIDKRIYSYNSGTMMQSNLYFFEVTKNKRYLDEAKLIAKSSAARFYNKGRFTDDYWFNAVLLRGYQHLLQYDKNTEYLAAFQKAVDNALANDRNEKGLMGVKKEKNLVGQGGMLEILARFAYLQKNGWISKN